MTELPTATLCLIVRNERRYLPEWIAYHRLLKFRDIIVYSNACSDGTDDFLAELAAKGIIYHRRWPDDPEQPPQIPAYKDAVRKCRTKWICFLDTDEFFVLKAAKTIPEFLSRFNDDVTAIAVNWRIFGTSGHMRYEPDYVTRRFTLAAVREHNLNLHCKTIAVVDSIIEPHIHRVFTAYGRYVDTKCRTVEIVRNGFTPSVEHEVAQINHYVLRSREEFEEKRLRGNANRTRTAPDQFTTRPDQYYLDLDRNECEDDILASVGPLIEAEVMSWTE